MNKIYVILVLQCLSTLGLAQISKELVHESPYNVIYNHLHYLQRDSYDLNRSLLSIPPDQDNSADKAIKIKEYLDGKGLYVKMQDVPQNSNYIDSAHNQHLYQLFSSEPQILVEKIGDNWYYAPSTCRAINDLHHAVYPFGTHLPLTIKSQFLQYPLFGMALWKWLGAIIILLLAAVVYKGIQWISDLFLNRVLKRWIDISADFSKHRRQLSRIIGLSVVTWLLSSLLPLLKINPWLNSMIIRGLRIALIVFIILFIRQLIKIGILFLERLTKRTVSTLDDQLLPVLDKLAMIILWGLGIIYILDYLNVNVTAMIAGISVGGLALALAAQDTVKNFFGSMVIFLDRPFQIGDWIQCDGVDGTVEEVGVRSTRVRTFANSLTYIPNARLADSVVNNMGLRRFRRYTTKLGITYDTPTESIDKFVEGIRQIVRIHPRTRKDYFEVHLNELGSSSINILLYTFFEVDNWSDELKCRHQIIYAIMTLAESLGVRFAFPTQTIHIEEMPIQGQSMIPIARHKLDSDYEDNKVMNQISDYFQSDHDVIGKTKAFGGDG